MPESSDPRLRALIELLDDDPVVFTVERWRERNFGLYFELAQKGLVDADLVSPEAHRFLTDTLVHPDNPAATDPQNAGHIRAQNENTIYYAISAGVPAEVLTVALAAGFIHDLNKSIGDPLRRDDFAVHAAGGELVGSQATLAISVGLNHLGDRTRAALDQATRLPVGALDPEVARGIDRVIVHHGLGSSRFIRRLVDGDNEWWGAEFVDPETGARKLVHPSQPGLTLASVIHDLADSTQQMQEGVAWLHKYPFGFWAGGGRTWWQMLSSRDASEQATIPQSLWQQIEVESETCREIVVAAKKRALLEDHTAALLDEAIAAASVNARAWVADDEATLAEPEGTSVYHAVAKGKGIRPADAVELLRARSPVQAEHDEIDRLIAASARALDVRRNQALARLIDR
jgi:hypothetical protein